MRVCVITLGCKVNQYESQAMLSGLVAAGFTACERAADSDVILVNSCTVTAASDSKVRQTLRRARRENPRAVLVLTGCMPQAFPAAAEKLKEADIVLGNANHAALRGDIRAFLSNRRRIVDIAPHTGKFEPMCVGRFYERTRAFVKIEDGCNRFCSYCIIPYARGRVCSKPLGDFRREAAEIAANGYREIVLTGINLSAYGQEFGLTLCDAVEAAGEPDGIRRVRLGSLEPERLDAGTVARLRRQAKLCPQFHLSLQSGCDRTLKRMNRHYTAGEYLAIVRNLRASFENAALTTDVMVGFPGETERDFRESLDFVREIGFAKMHVFIYSRRPGTAAAGLPGQIPPETGQARSRRMLAAAREMRRAFFGTQTGLTEPVLVERRRAPDGEYEGYTANYTPVRFRSREGLCGQIVPVRITRAEDDFCLGEPEPSP
ncbi:MAG TPA: tRNA (N(6)-L-threonylcarbamoyladenosine(37)-C(2))-methylthiotransferase MtaB [Ruminococcaceae bacterium]|jgi:threonylcarbamoyladenosine tRNA methylthiotransferase MtaB|nr:tRNA (N(6)-L-threonylcarbamoyladenosine(37)-C(2))-methylthiotransferase MtaB [Oscillospiraceae bacterium]HBG55599.1 tRNA (N(6)-L-threonylcarbamoyladenosine(37)-C(2))-methylthiotransferase MtaB [Oscillospiraceae bacterium]HBQ47033.1 tRNA (N(6)-L-threonylcarbamoyladenosine(37)-C(2))-methylthiotransferase MtaB [Oscillospiraceae bacterium]HBT91345.1 tRNA (N(6)-L-threonylcarbamoyladenosine(37)-C(2))-methylthiotransferase MtaB [Oscillospiraceae bacterium]HCB91243.1 tRNA (N(6)-L-threonylcarbamoylad